MRKKPQQKRALQTLDHFYEATAQLLQARDTGSVTTNHIAERAGFSIGTLYRYFPNKRAILHGMAKREMERLEQAAIEKLSAAENANPTELVRLCAGFLINAFGRRSEARRRIILVMANDRDVVTLIRLAHESQIRVLRVLEELLVGLAPDRYRILSDAQMHIASAAFSGAVRIPTVSSLEIVEEKHFELEMTDFLERQFLRLPDGSVASDMDF